MADKKTVGQKRKAESKVEGKKIPGFVEGYDIAWLKSIGDEHPEYQRLKEKYPEDFE